MITSLDAVASKTRRNLPVTPWNQCHWNHDFVSAEDVAVHPQHLCPEKMLYVSKKTGGELQFTILNNN